MSIEKKSLEILKAGLDDTFDLMDEEAMDLIEGGYCSNGYCGGPYCAGTYSPDDPTTPASTPTPSSAPTCECGTNCPCRTCGCK
ncbi:hypothetical protein [uncultured Bacteroides sp.]|uniref:hypothetical protein n=1 Tax=uncultured Bacteroides sp. TaxID=162156 RepID=UPI00259B2628|nr:hypothetical protein [uncultured Bacteroides sp.]